VHTHHEDEPLFDAMATMRRAGVRRVPVVNARGVLQCLLMQALSSERLREPQRRR